MCTSSWKYLKHSPVYTVYSHKVLWLFWRFIHSLHIYIQLIHAFGIQRCNRQQTHYATSQRKPFLYARLQSLSLLHCAELRALLWKQILSGFLFITQLKPVKSCSQKLALLFFLSLFFMHARTWCAYVLPPHPTPTTQTHKQTHCTIKFIKASSYKSWHKYGAHQTGNHLKKSADKRKKRTTWLTGTTEHACEWTYKTKS